MVKINLTNGKEVTCHNADSFGVSNNGDLIMVETMDVPSPPGMPQSVQRVGSNCMAFAAGTWETAEVQRSKVQGAQAIPRGIKVT